MTTSALAPTRVRRRWLPLLALLALIGLLAAGLRQPRAGDAPLTSPLIGRLAPGLDLPRLDDPSQRFDPQALAGRVWVLNVWASWCEPCRQEHAQLLHLQRDGWPLVGLNYKDSGGAAWLAARGNPFAQVLRDEKGRVGLDWGVYGVPETFLIDKAGRVRAKHTGPLSAEMLTRDWGPLMKRLQEE
jgi:cytochrome c biogenesis protein CcmG, thiol:disulfide interchange protein DsbE